MVGEMIKKGLHVANERQVRANGRGIVQKYRILARRMALLSCAGILLLFGGLVSAETGCWPYIVRGKMQCEGNAVQKSPQ